MSRVRTPGEILAAAAIFVAKPDRAQHADRLRTDIDAGADLAEGRRALENIRFDAEMGQRGRRRQSGQTAPDDSDA